MKKETVALPLLFALVAFVLTAFKPLTSPGDRVVWTDVVRLEPTTAASSVDTKGLAIFRLTADRVLTYKLLVEKLDETDMLTNAHIHYSTGAIAIPLTAGITDLGHFQSMQLTQQQYDLLLSGTTGLFVNLHSTRYPGGILRGDLE